MPTQTVGVRGVVLGMEAFSGVDHVCWGSGAVMRVVPAKRDSAGMAGVEPQTHAQAITGNEPQTHVQVITENEAFFLNPPPSTLNPQPTTLSPQPSTLNPQPSTPNPVDVELQSSVSRCTAV